MSILQYAPQTSWQLAHLAGCSDPDQHDGIGFADFTVPDGFEPSPGARFLRSVETDVAYQITDGGWDADADIAHEIADSAVPIYTHELWRTFTDLGAYEEDPSELGCEADDMTRAAGVCLYMIAERLARSLADEIMSGDEEA